MHLATHQSLGQEMPELLGDPQLALRGTLGPFAARACPSTHMAPVPAGATAAVTQSVRATSCTS